VNVSEEVGRLLKQEIHDRQMAGESISRSDLILELLKGADRSRPVASPNPGADYPAPNPDAHELLQRILVEAEPAVVQGIIVNLEQFVKALGVSGDPPRPKTRAAKRNP
jgi:hypothetical protein